MKQFLLVCLILLVLSIPVATMANTSYTFALPVRIQVEVPNGYMIFDHINELFPTNIPDDKFQKIKKMLDGAGIMYATVRDDGFFIAMDEKAVESPDFVKLSQSELEKRLDATKEKGSTLENSHLLSSEITNYNGIPYIKAYYYSNNGYSHYELIMGTVVNERIISIHFINDTEIDDSYSSTINGFMNGIRFTSLPTPEPTAPISASGRTEDQNSLDQKIAIGVAVGLVASIVFATRLLKKKESSSSASIFSPDMKNSTDVVGSSDCTVNNQDGVEQNPYYPSYPYYPPEPSTQTTPTHLCPYCGLPTPKDSPCKYCGK